MPSSFSYNKYKFNYIIIYVNATDFGNDFNKQRTQRKTEGKTNTRWSPGEYHWHAFNTVVDQYLPEKQAKVIHKIK